MSLDVYLSALRKVDIFERNITHNLSRMAIEAGIYKHLWYPEEVKITHARDLIEPLTQGLALLKADPARFKVFEPANGWGTYEDFVEFVEAYLEACRNDPSASVRVSR